MTKKKNPSGSSARTSVVTGVAGFLGSHLTDLLLARGHKVIGIDNFVTGTVDNISHLGGNPNFKFIQQDVTEFIFLGLLSITCGILPHPQARLTISSCQFKH